jgi:small nuclear ribonucleoprotein D3
MSIGVPIKLLHEAENHVITVELKSGELYRGYLMEAEDTMNMRLDDVFVTAKDGRNYHLDQVFVRGSQVRFIIIPDMLKNSPMFKRIANQAKKGKNALLSKARGRPMAK